jgi:hypothetical protein
MTVPAGPRVDSESSPPTRDRHRPEGTASTEAAMTRSRSRRSERKNPEYERIGRQLAGGSAWLVRSQPHRTLQQGESSEADTVVDGRLCPRHGRGTVDRVLPGRWVRDRRLESRRTQEPRRVGGRLPGDGWHLNGHGTMITRCLSVSRDRQPASKGKESIDMAPQPLHEEGRRHTVKVAWPRTAGLLDQQQ